MCEPNRLRMHKCIESMPNCLKLWEVSSNHLLSRFVHFNHDTAEACHADASVLKI